MSQSFYLTCTAHRVRGPEIALTKLGGWGLGDAFRSDEAMEATVVFFEDHAECAHNGSFRVLNENSPWSDFSRVGDWPAHDSQGSH
jgi:hypothetical protein